MPFLLKHMTAILCLFGLLVALPATAQTTQPSTSSDKSLPKKDPLDQFKVLKVVTNVDSWIQRGQTSKIYIPVHTDNVSGIKVTIRLNGMRFGSGEVLAPNPLLPAIGDINSGEKLNLMSLAQKATDLALEEARRNFERRRMNIQVVEQVESQQDEDILDPIDPDEKRNPGGNIKRVNFANIAGQFTFEIQFALQPRRLLIRDIKEIPLNNKIGVEGLALTANGRWAMVFPADGITMNYSHRNMVDALIGKLELSPNNRALIGKPAGPVPYEFDIVHMVKHHPLSEPKALFRAQKSQPMAPHLPQSIDEMILRQAKNLLYWQNAEGRYLSSYDAVADRETLPNNLDNAALVTYVLSLLESKLSVKDLATQLALKNEKGLVRILMDMGIIRDPSLNQDQTPPGRDKAELNSTALTLMALIQSPKLSGYQKPREELAHRLLTMQNPDGWFRPRMIANARLGNQNLADFAGQALACYALTMLYDYTKNPQHRSAALKAIDALYSKMNDNQILNTMPWLQMAEFNLTLKGEKLPGTNAYLKKFGPAMWKLQITPKLAKAGYFTPDAVGGFYLRNFAMKEPTWQSARILAAQTAAWPMLTETEKKQWREGLLLGARYLDQLTLRDTDIYYVRDKKKALGAMRISTFDSKLNINATAVGLMTNILIREKIQ